MFKWDTKTTGRIVNCKWPGDCREIGTLTRVKGIIKARIEFAKDNITIMGGKNATTLKNQIAIHVNRVNNEKVIVKNLMSGKDVEVNRGDIGGVCDPSTESYWCK